MTIFGREPVAWVGIIAAVVLTVIQTLAGQGVISDVVAGRAVDATNAATSVALILVPLVAAYFQRKATTPVAAPALPAGTPVTVITPGDAPNTTTVLPGA